MPLADEFINTDLKAFLVSRWLDESLDQFDKHNSYLLKKPNKTLKDIINICTKINEIINGFENPPREIMEELTQEGKSELLSYYKNKKRDLVKKIGENVILGYEAIRLAHQFWEIIPNYLFKIEELHSSPNVLGDIEMMYNDLNDEKVNCKRALLSSRNLLPQERQYLFNVFISEIDNLLVENLIAIYVNKIKSMLQKNVKDFCIYNSIPIKVSDIEKKLILSSKLNKLKNQFYYMINGRFDKYEDAIRKEIDEVIINVEQAYLTKLLSEKQILSIKQNIDAAVSDIMSQKDKKSMDRIRINFQSSYSSEFSKSIDYYLTRLIDDLILRGFSENLRDKYLFVKG